MTGVAYPVGLPRPQQDGYAYTVSTLSGETTLDRGHSLRRRRGLGRTTRGTLTFTYTRAEFVTFVEWWRNDIDYGTATVSIALRNGYGDATQDVKITGPYKAENLSGGWRVQFPIEWLEAPILPEGDLLPFLTGDVSFDASELDALHVLVHTTAPETLTLP
jgi:hypothetical protein